MADMDLERIIEEAKSGRVGMPAPMPVQMVFSTSRIDVVTGSDLSDREVVNLLVTSGNGTFQVVVPLPKRPAPGEIRSAPVILAMALLEGSGWEAVYRGNGGAAGDAE